MTARPAAQLTLAVSFALASGAASASIDAGSLYTAPQGGRVYAQFVSSSAGWTGSVYLLGYAAQGTQTVTYSASNDAHGLGRFLFSNKKTSAGFVVDLGLFDPGATLHFAYRITAGGPVGQVSRSDIPADVIYFGLSQGTDSIGAYSRVHIEDIKGSRSDFDYNDVAFNLRLKPTPGQDNVPAPGAAALVFLAFGIARARRRGA